MPAAIDLTGHTYGSWTVLYPVLPKLKDKQWVCRCVCGVEKPVFAAGLRSGTSRQCTNCSHKLREGLPGTPWKPGRKPPSRISSEDRARGQVLSNYKVNAGRRNYCWRLTNEQAYELFSGDCYYCGSPPSLTRASSYGPEGFTYNGIDRRDNSRGYEMDNCVSCCHPCNYIKLTRSEEEYIAAALRIAARHPLPAKRQAV